MTVGGPRSRLGSGGGRGPGVPGCGCDRTGPCAGPYQPSCCRPGACPDAPTVSGPPWPPRPTAPGAGGPRRHREGAAEDSATRGQRRDHHRGRGDPGAGRRHRAVLDRRDRPPRADPGRAAGRRYRRALFRSLRFGDPARATTTAPPWQQVNMIIHGRLLAPAYRHSADLQPRPRPLRRADRPTGRPVAATHTLGHAGHPLGTAPGSPQPAVPHVTMPITRHHAEEDVAPPTNTPPDRPTCPNCPTPSRCPQ